MKYNPPSTPNRLAPRFAEIATFMRVPIAKTLEDTDIGIFGVPYDGALTNRAGTRHGPREVRNQSTLMRAVNHATRINPFELARIRDMGDVHYRAVAKEPVALIHIDAHTDTTDSFQGSRFNHGAPFRRAVEEGLIDPTKTIQIGIRGTQNTAEGWDFSAATGMRVMCCEEFHTLGPETAAAQARALVGDNPVYLTYDILCLLAEAHHGAGQ